MRGEVVKLYKKASIIVIELIRNCNLLCKRHNVNL